MALHTSWTASPKQHQVLSGPYMELQAQLDLSRSGPRNLPQYHLETLPTKRSRMFHMHIKLFSHPPSTTPSSSFNYFNAIIIVQMNVVISNLTFTSLFLCVWLFISLASTVCVVSHTVSVCVCFVSVCVCVLADV